MRPSLWKFLLLCLLFLGPLAADRFKNKYFGKPPKYYRHSSGLSKSEFKYLFPTAAALGAIYVASRMRPRAHLRSYRDLDGYSVCEGRHYEMDSLFTGPRTYSYFLCPDDPDQPFKRYCCFDSVRGVGVCCSYDEKRNYYTYSRYGLIGGLVSLLCIFVIVGFLGYCLCARHRRSSTNTPPVVFPTPPTSVPISKPTSGPEFAPPYPYPAQPSFPNPQYTPTAPPASMPQPGSGWGAPASNTVGSGWMGPPPPYSAVQ